MQEKLSTRVPGFPRPEDFAPLTGDTVEGSLVEPEKNKAADPEPEVEPTRDELLNKLRSLEDEVKEQSSLVQDQEIRSSIEKPISTEADVAVDRQPQVPKRIASPGVASQAECSVLRDTNPGDALTHYRNVIRELLSTLSTIAGSTARPGEELSAIAQHAINKHSKEVR